MNTAEGESVEVRDGTSVFDRVIAGVDGTDAGFEAARQAARLVAPDGRLELFTAVYLAEASLTGWSAPRVAEELECQADATIHRAAALAGPRAETRFVNGPPPDFAARLRARQRRKRRSRCSARMATAAHPRSCSAAWSANCSTTRRARCSMARPPRGRRSVPARDRRRSRRLARIGRPPSQRPNISPSASRSRCASYRARRQIRRSRRRATTCSDETVVRHPSRHSSTPSTDADIVVVGSRGLHGSESLGSVSERVAHQALARCSSSGRGAADGGTRRPRPLGEGGRARARHRHRRRVDRGGGSRAARALRRQPAAAAAASALPSPAPRRVRRPARAPARRRNRRFRARSATSSRAWRSPPCSS